MIKNKEQEIEALKKGKKPESMGSFDRWLEPLKDSHETKWTKMKGTIVEDGQNRSVKSESGRYYIGIFEDSSALPTRTKVSFLVGQHGEHRGVAKN